MKKTIAFRSKPAVAFANARKASENIKVKCDIVRDIVIRATGLIGTDKKRELLNCLPQTIRQFNRWNSDAIPPGIDTRAFKANANQTLRSDPHLFALAKQCTDSAREASLRPTAEEKRSTTAASLKRQLQLSNDLRSILETELITLKRQLTKLEDDSAGLRRALASEKRESSKTIADMETRMATMRAVEMPTGDNVIVQFRTKSRSPKNRTPK